MKKFLSLLLTLTMVLSLAVVPARAADPVSHAGTLSSLLTAESTATVEKNSTTTVTAAISSIDDAVRAALTDNEYTNRGTPTLSWRWSFSNGSGSIQITAGSETNTVTVQGLSAGAATLTVTYTASYTIPVSSGEGNGSDPDSAVHTFTGTKDIIVTVTDKQGDANTAFANAVFASIAVKYSGRSYPLTDGTVTAYSYEGDSATWTIDNKAALKTELEKKYDSVTINDPNNNKIVVTARTKPDEASGATAIEVRAEISLVVETPSFTATAAPTTVTAGGVVVLGIQSGATLPSSGLSYKWEYAKAADAPTFSTIGNGASFNWAVKGSDGKDLAEGAYVVKCTVTDGQATVATDTVDVTVQKDIWGLFASSDSLKAINLAPGQSATLPTDILLYAKDSNGKKTGNAISEGVEYGWSYTSSALEVKDGKVYVKTGASSNTYILTRTATYQGKTYKQNISIVVSSLSYELDPVVNGDSKSYSVNTLASYARSRIASRLGESASSITVNSLTVKSRNPLTGGAFSTNANVGTTFNRSSGSTISGSFTYSASKTTLGYASIVMTVETNRGSFDVTYSIPVIPISRAFEAQYPQVSTSGSNYIYTVSAPSGFDRIYVINKTGATPATSQLTTMPSGAASVSLSASDFNSATGKCTLYIMAWNSNYSNYSSSSSSYGKYYYGTLEVYLQSNDIEYTGVAGSTVNFQHSSFTAFLNAMNVSTSTDYYEFQDVTFTYFNSTTQGTLYYGSTAMTSGTYNSSSYFNSATKITNLDNVSFAIKSTIPSTIKTISIPFQLHAKQYRSGTYSSTFVRDVTFSGRVVISVAREDVVINVAAGDAVKLDATAFLTYLRNSSTSYRNANIDYVTFSQNLSVSSSNSAYANGALYTYYTNSYSFGNPVTSTDRFYYNPTTYNVNRLSDVAFRANAYASAGTTVYIPFTIKLLNSNATVTGTLAAKIANAVNFYDVAPGAYYYDAVKWAVGAGVTKGTGNNMFSPAKSCTRAEIVTFLWRAAKSPAPKSYSNPFTDVYSGMGSDFYNAILWAVGEGITTGTTTSKFSPNDTCTRGQIVTFLHRYLKTPSGYYSNPFKDVKSGYYCYNAVIWAYGSGVAKGSSATTFSPDATCTRGDAVTFLYRALVK